MTAIKRIFGFLFWCYFWLLFIPFTVVLGLIFLFISLFLPKYLVRKLHILAVFWGRVGMALLWSYPKIYGKLRENLRHEALVLASNHQSQIDILIALAAYPINFLFMSKKEVFNIPLVGTAMRKMGYISVDRENPTKAALSIKEAIRELKQGYAVLIYPEGTRSPNAAEMLPFKLGTLRIASEGEFPIVPIVVYGTQQISDKGKRFYLWPHKTAILILDPIEKTHDLHPANKKSPLSDQQKLAKLRDIMMQAYRTLAQHNGRLPPDAS
ncbi:MAG: 1-acyl-sn-glycerol-3-phosphate acyltransferase [Leptospiraceae bacterium]|nr:1-acyl-sn-glycerol-3-phosphate acyltransferase [Leptospiraceae bacterium]MDW8305818.1 lysophospholipid acyltransferase family protein [Leptospiraceae bacterium]